ncbi:hypothetical protein STW0522ENT51_14310 [Enterobacter kobei]|nr:hypothetical protein STW0522ENT51_14310 [Enterobacter kobei]
MALKRKNLARQAGFTLLELMVVIVILGVLASMVVPNLGNDSNLLIVFYVQIMPDDLVMQLHRF